jgi:hypothetical protein
MVTNNSTTSGSSIDLPGHRWYHAEAPQIVPATNINTVINGPTVALAVPLLPGQSVTVPVVGATRSPIE